jgi:SAM-dependent methyltransferase
LDRYRVDREWNRYEGTPQRDLFRELRERFLERHPGEGPWGVDIGSGPGRFTAQIAAPGMRLVLLDVSREMLERARATARARNLGSTVSAVRGNGLDVPLRAARFATVVALGNPLGFAEARADDFWGAVLPLVAPGGSLLLEAVSGPGESSRYLRRLPPSAVARLLHAPMNLVRARLEREGFREAPAAPSSGSRFRRHRPEELAQRLRAGGFELTEVLSVAPSLGTDAPRLAAIRSDAAAWRRLLELEEAVGREPARWTRAAALLVAARRTASGGSLARS